MVIVMLTPLSENGVRQCYHYWPDEGSNLYHVYEVLPRVAAVGRGLGGHGLWRALAGLPCAVASRCPLKPCCAVGPRRRCPQARGQQTPRPSRHLCHGDSGRNGFHFFNFMNPNLDRKDQKMTSLGGQLSLVLENRPRVGPFSEKSLLTPSLILSIPPAPQPLLLSGGLCPQCLAFLSEGPLQASSFLLLDFCPHQEGTKETWAVKPVLECVL